MKQSRINAIGTLLTLAAVVGIVLLPLTLAVGERIESGARRYDARTAANVSAYRTQAVERAELWTTAMQWGLLSIWALLIGVVGIVLLVGLAFASRAWHVARRTSVVQTLPPVALVDGRRVVDTRRAITTVTLRLRDAAALPALERAGGSGAVRELHTGGEW